MTREVFVCWVLLLLAGLVLVVLSPPFSGPDEQVHFLRMWAISRGDLVAERRTGGVGSELPCELPTLASAVTPNEPEASYSSFREPGMRAISRRLRPSAHPPDCFVTYTFAAVYTPLPYLPSAAAMRLARVFDAGALEQLVAARTANLVLSWLILGAALRVAPRISWTILAFASLPMAAFVRSTHVSDSLLGAMALLLVAYVVRALDERSQVDPMGIVTAALITLVKPLYLFVPLIVLVPGVLGVAIRRRLLTAAVLVVATLVGLEFSRAGFVPQRHDRPDPAGAAAAMLSTPLRLAEVAAHDMVISGPGYLMSFTGVLGRLDAPVPRTTRMMLFVVMLSIVVAESQRLESSATSRIAALLLIVASVLVVQLSLFFSYTPPGFDRIIGVQGRYFLPIAPLVLLALPRLVDIKPGFARIVGICFVPMSLAVTIVVIGIRYWW